MRGLRNRIVHDYEGIKLILIWEIIATDLKLLKEKLEVLKANWFIIIYPYQQSTLNKYNSYYTIDQNITKHHEQVTQKNRPLASLKSMNR